MGAISVTCVFGTRPEAIKMAPVILELRRRPRSFNTRVLVTAQHREMLDQVLRLFRLKPDHDLNIMTHDQDLFDITSRTLEGIKQAFYDDRPELVLVQGDTTTTFTASLAGYYYKARVGHIEAGLRTYDKWHPYPEELNRRMTSALADFNFAPTETARQNLIKENIDPESIFVTGNTVIDAMLMVAKDGYRFSDSGLSSIDFANKRVVLVTAHRRENWGPPLASICEAIKTLHERFNDIEIVFSMHLNPLVRSPVEEALGDLARVRLITPLEYEPFVQMMNKAYLILSDSGGIQEEAPSLGKPVLVLRETTERPEGIEAGTAKLVGRDTDRIVSAASLLLSDKEAYDCMAKAHNPYGDGQAAKLIADILESRLA